MKKTFLIFTLILLTNDFFAQITCKGKVIDSETNETLEYVSIFCEEENIGTITNSKGEFNLRLSNPESKVSFSFIGYNTLVTKALPDSIVFLQRAVMELGEVVVTPDNPLNVNKLLSDIINNYKDSYHTEKSVCTIHLKQFDTSDGKYIKAIDMIGELEIPPFRHLKKTDNFKFSAIQSNLYEDTTALNIGFYPKTIFSIFSLPYQLTNHLKKNVKDYNFEINKLYQDNSFIYEIIFSRKEPKSRNQFFGILYVNDGTKAIIDFKVRQDKTKYKANSYNYNNETLIFQPQENEIKINYVKTYGRYRMAYAILYDKYMLGNEHRSVNFVLSCSNFNKDYFENAHPVNLSSDLYSQLSKMNLINSIQYSKILPTEKELDFFERNEQ